MSTSETTGTIIPENLTEREFHISRRSRDTYRFDESIYTMKGNVILPNFTAARVFAQKIIDTRGPEKAGTVNAGQINAMGLIDEILHYIVNLYREQKVPRLLGPLTSHLERVLSEREVDNTLKNFLDQFPPLAVYRGKLTQEEYFNGESSGVPNKHVILEELVMLWLANSNEAFQPFRDLFEDEDLKKGTMYGDLMHEVKSFMMDQPGFGPNDKNLVDMLREPAEEVPGSLHGQLEYILEKWGPLLGKYRFLILSSMDLIREEEKIRGPPGGKGEPQVLVFSGLRDEPEHFSPDKDWMPRLVLVAKNSYVWLSQLSRKYGWHIHRLDQVPDEELDMMATWGFTGLWLIGLWERSRASQRIKQMCGNPDAAASAYSLFDYIIAEDLGGEESYANLRDRCKQRGIRLETDMVLNHMGIDSKWVIEKPDWFVSVKHVPFPNYTFNGPDLSSDPGVGIYLEDRYYSRTDAAVVFKRVDKGSGRVDYIYHGNDGTSMPWNDTAQLNYLNPEVREAMVNTVLYVAGKFPIIRFDAAMTLTKMHYHRLWYPEPGSGGDIPSRAGYGIHKQQFDELMPDEFWREVVDRVAAQVPDTLLLAEAFWLLEGYFVRTLGMHRVYNSAFMNMMKEEQNAKYRSVIKNTIEFDPEVLKRYVNFLNNPDEDTAVAQFGKGDKYFGVTAMMATIPGLPMFGHGQVEGYTEKYGMEYKRAYYNEVPDNFLVERHVQEIFPIVRKRYLFAGVDNFLLYDLFKGDGAVDENVYAYSNRYGDERGLFLFNNRYGESDGWIKNSAAYSRKTGPGDKDRALVQKTIGQGLDVPDDGNTYLITRDTVTGREFLFNCAEIHSKGIHVHLGAYKYRLFLDMRIEKDGPEKLLSTIWKRSAGEGIDSIERELIRMKLEPARAAISSRMEPGMIKYIREAMASGTGKSDLDNAIQQLGEASGKIAINLAEYLALAVKIPTIQKIAVSRTTTLSEAILRRERTPTIKQTPDSPGVPTDNAGKVTSELPAPPEHLDLDVLIAYILLSGLGDALEMENPRDWTSGALYEQLLAEPVLKAFKLNGKDTRGAQRALRLLQTMIELGVKTGFTADGPRGLLDRMLTGQPAREYLQLNIHEDIVYINKESFEELIGAIAFTWEIEGQIETSGTTVEKDLESVAILDQLSELGEKAGYKPIEMMKALDLESSGTTETDAGDAGKTKK